MCGNVLGVATSSDDKKIILGVLGALTHRDAMALVEPFLNLSEFQAEAEIAYSAIVLSIIKSDPAAARSGLEKVVAFENQELVKNAKIEINKFAGSR